MKLMKRTVVLLMSVVLLLSAIPGVVLGQAVDALTSGMRKAKPEADLISWTYGQRLWNHDDIREYILFDQPTPTSS